MPNFRYSIEVRARSYDAAKSAHTQLLQGKFREAMLISYSADNWTLKYETNVKTKVEKFRDAADMALWRFAQRQREEPERAQEQTPPL